MPSPSPRPIFWPGEFRSNSFCQLARRLGLQNEGGRSMRVFLGGVYCIAAAGDFEVGFGDTRVISMSESGSGPGSGVLVLACVCCRAVAAGEFEVSTGEIRVISISESGSGPGSGVWMLDCCLADGWSWSTRDSLIEIAGPRLCLRFREPLGPG